MPLPESHSVGREVGHNFLATGSRRIRVDSFLDPLRSDARFLDPLRSDARFRDLLPLLVPGGVEMAQAASDSLTSASARA